MKVLSIGLDGASFELIQQFIGEGILPTFEQLAMEGIFYSLPSTTPPHTAPGWVTSLTGVNPGKHGIYQFWETQAQDYAGEFMGSNDVKVPFIWDLLGEYGYSSGLINIPMSHPPQKINGYMLTWPLSNTLHYSYPPELINEISRNGGQYLSDLVTMFHGDTDYIDMALEITKKRGRTLEYLLANRSSDFLMEVFTEIDRVSHFYWKYMRADKKGKLENAIRNIYRKTDQVLKQVLSVSEQDTTLLIYSDHGFQAGEMDFYVQTFLEKAGLLSLRKDDAYIAQDNWFELQGEDGIYHVDWDKTTAYMAAPGSYGININLKGRQAQGIVDPHSYAEVRSRVIKELKAVRHPVKGTLLFREVLPRESVYSGELLHKAPDIIVIPENYGIMLHHKITDDRLFNFNPEQNGMHSANGIFLLWGNAVKGLKHKRPRGLYDVAPTILDLFHISAPSYMDGESIFKLPLKSYSSASKEGKAAYSEKEEEDIKRHLKTLGYY
ncbi:MAG TPA: alkaline phosphatase family protein [Candidatus Scatovicinus merdipullorum]|nr:alkaline phosphatase family protein [Candidatus Scatovicinus merdipullorum]